MRFRFRPRYRALAHGSVALGLAGAVGGWWASGPAATMAVVLGGAAAVLAAGYLRSPAWRFVVVLDDDGLEVASRAGTRFRVPWDRVVRVVASPTTSSCFVDGGHPARSLLVPGVGAPAPYDLEDRAALVAAIVARVPSDRISLVDRLENHAAPPSSDRGLPD